MWKEAVVTWRYYPGICLGSLRKTTKTLSHNSRSPGWYLNPGPPEYEARVLTTRPRRLVKGVEDIGFPDWFEPGTSQTRSRIANRHTAIVGVWEAEHAVGWNLPIVRSLHAPSTKKARELLSVLFITRLVYSNTFNTHNRLNEWRFIESIVADVYKLQFTLPDIWFSGLLPRFMFIFTCSLHFLYCTVICEPGSSVSTVSGYGLDDRAIEVRSLAEAKGFFL
jgi:hypothetical protein